jgi:hypothetical protein
METSTTLTEQLTATAKRCRKKLMQVKFSHEEGDAIEELEANM